MDEAAPQAVQDTTTADLAEVSEWLAALRMHWGDVYVFGHDEQGYWAVRRLCPGSGMLRGETAEELGALVAAEIKANPS
jgi:hypothetical protein